MNSAEELILRISGDSAGGVKAINDILSPIENLGKSISSGITDPIGSATGALNAFLADMGPMGVGFGALGGAAAVAGGEIFRLGKEAAAAGEQMRVFGLLTSETATEVAAIKYAADVTGGSLEQMQGL